MSVENPGGKRWWRGGYVCECVTLIYPIMERRAAEAGVGTPSDVYQYCYNAGGVSASAGTHDAGGVTDHNQWTDAQLRIQRECGGAAWYRTPAEGFDYHTHIVLCGCPHLSSGAADQVTDYRNGRNGLANNGPDTGPDVPYITWQDAYYKYAGDNPPDDEGLFGMTKRISKYRGAAQTLETNDYSKTLATDDDGGPSIATNTKGMVDVIVYVTGGLARDDEIGFRWIYVGTKDGKTNVDWQSSVIDFRSNGGTDRVQFVHHFDLKPAENGWDHKLRLAVNTGGKRVTFGAVETKGWED